MRELKVLKPIAALENLRALDVVTNPLKKAVLKVVPRPVADVLHGVPLGHPLHPLLVLVPTGAWFSVAVLDLLPGNARAARILTGVGVLSALPTAASGEMDWAALHQQQLRVGLVHSVANVVAIGLYAGAWLTRTRGDLRRGKLMALGGLAAVSFSGYLGGHMSYRQASGANHAEDVPHRFPQGWQFLGVIDDLPEGRPTRRDVAGEPLLVVRRGERVQVLSNACSHLSGPLDEGELVEDEGQSCIRCPWHGSEFALDTGEVAHGPATSPQPRFEVRVADGEIEVRLPHAG